MLDSLARTGSRATHQAEVRTPIHPLRKVPVMMTGDSWPQKHIERILHKDCDRKGSVAKKSLVMSLKGLGAKMY
jgi:hypothetical protein